MTEGEHDSGKTEFLFSAPTPNQIIAIDRGIDGMGRNPEPPAWRKKQGVYVKVCKVPMEPTEANFNASKPEMNDYLRNFREVKADLYAALDNKQSATVCMDTDSDFFRLQTLAEFGRLSQIMPINRENLNAAKRAQFARCWGANKIVIFTNKLVPMWEGVKNPDGTVKTDEKGKEVRVRSGSMVSAGFDEDNYLWQVRIRHLFNKDKGSWGLRIMRCKHNKMYEGMELWDDDCCFAGLVQAIFPTTPLDYWGM